tara:strand:+ start:531 stop:893 length:363 start_codon:yes stop_codon:yes gene_type:complete
MSHFAKLDENNVVVFVTVGRQEDDGLEAELSARTGETYKQTSYNTQGGVHLLGGKPLRKNYAGIGYTYDKKLDGFIPPKPFPSWKLEKKTCLWLAPISMPDDGSLYTWDEASKTWTKIVE